MAVLEVIEELTGAGGSWSLQSGFAARTRLKIKADRPTGPLTILNAAGVKVGDTYRYPITKPAVEADSTLYVQSVAIEGVVPLAGAVDRWTVEVSYGWADPAVDDRGPVDPITGRRDPFAAPPRLTWRPMVEEEAVILDRSGGWILNKAGDPFSPPLTIPRQTVTAVVRRLEREFDPAWITDYMGRVNSSTWLGFAAGSVLCAEITADRVWNADVDGWAWDTEYQFAFKPSILSTSGKIIRKGWAARPLNEGLRQKVSGKKIACVTEDGLPVSSPALLKSDGTQAAPTDDPIYLTFDIYPEVDFAGLNMPIDLFTAGTPEVP